MSKKHFIALADAVKGKGFTRAQLVILAEFCRSQNSRFDWNLWLNYVAGKCGPCGGAIKARKDTQIQPTGGAS